MTGAAGYVGSHVLRLFLEQNIDCVVLDDLSKGHREAVSKNTPIYIGNTGDENMLAEIFSAHPIQGILHFAGFIEVGESVKNPGKYFENNIAASIPLLEKAKSNRVPWIVFSSSAAVYGEPEKTPLDENAPKRPNNPYGLTKWTFEQMLQYYDSAFGLRSISLRYFNAAGAHPKGDLGENHHPESHLIPLACKAALAEKPLSIFGNDYPTPDGTCIRDYVHIMDLAEAHLLSMQALQAGHRTDAYNIGSENGYSVKEVIQTVEKVSGKKVPVQVAARRLGDSAILVASSKKFQREFSWKPKHQSLETIVSSAWQWHQQK